MKVTQIVYHPTKGWSNASAISSENALVLAFAERPFGERRDVWQALKDKSGRATVLACSTAGGILGAEMHDEIIVGAVVEFEKTKVRSVSTTVVHREDSFEAGRKLAASLPHEDLTAVFILSDGLNVNGSELVRGMANDLPPQVTLSGGLAGDGSLFQATWVLSENGEPQANRVAAIGFYGPDIHFSYGSQGGWDKFGVERRVTRAEGTVLYELDGKPALKLYKEYLGHRAQDLPASGLLFPLALRSSLQSDKFLVRTILSVNEDTQSLVFAGDVPVGSYAQLMRANFDRLIQGAASAAEMAGAGVTQRGDALAIAISCVGRKLVLGARAEDELDAALAMLPANTKQIGFYSYGEMAPNGVDGPCQFHNQTMTITRFYEG